MDQIERTNRLYAELHATLRNGLFDQKVIWLADDFLKPDNRTERMAQHQRDRAEMFRVSSIVQNGKDERVPEWIRDLAKQQGKVN